MKTSDKNSTPLLLSALLLALLFAVYYYLVMPKMDEAKALDANVGALQGEISSIQEQIATIKEEQENAVENELAIRTQLPDNREVSKLLKSFEEIEFITDTRINSISFNSYDSLVSGSGIQDPNYVPSTEGATDSEGATQSNVETSSEASNSSAENAEGDEFVPVTTIATEMLPPNLKLLTYSLDLSAPNEEKLLLFIKEVERLQRVMHVDAIDFELPGEEQLAKLDEEENYDVTLQVTTFYYE